MMYVVLGPKEDVEWPKWADNFFAAYMAWSEIKSKDDIEFSNMGKFIKSENIPLAAFKEVITTTYSSQGLESMETQFIFGWTETAEKEQFRSEFGQD